MTPSVTIDLREETIASVRNDETGKKKLLIEDLKKARDLITDLLRNYQDQKDPRGQVYGFDPIYDVEIDRTGQGGFTIEFIVNVYSGCRDQNADIEEEMYVTIAIDFEKRSALLVGEELVPKRDPDEY